MEKLLSRLFSEGTKLNLLGLALSVASRKKQTLNRGPVRKRRKEKNIHTYFEWMKQKAESYNFIHTNLYTHTYIYTVHSYIQNYVLNRKTCLEQSFSKQAPRISHIHIVNGRNNVLAPYFRFSSVVCIPQHNLISSIKSQCNYILVYF